ncbi:MAG: hypothetical protein HZC49_02500 [Nitrospirae bacterium]|nr:hypothetical protein [Nitrospirota bacterium]
MARGRYRYLVLIVLAAVLVAVFYPSDKKRINKVLKACSESVLNEDIGQLMEHISYNYRDDYGGSYLALKKRAEMVFSRFNDFEITADVMRISVDGERAEAQLKVSIIATEDGRRGYFIGDAEKARDVRVLLEKSSYGWEIINIGLDGQGEGWDSNKP